MRERISSLSKKRALILLVVLPFLFISAIMVGCVPLDSTPRAALSKTLPSTWTPSEAEIATQTAKAIQVTNTPKQTHIIPAAPTQTILPGENWWSVSFGKLRKLRIKYGRETTDGGLLFWAQVENQAGHIVRDVIIKLTANGQLVWEKSISPETARVQDFQDLDDGTILIYGYYENGDYPLAPFFIQINENGELVTQKVYRGHYQTSDRFVLRFIKDTPIAFLGKLILSGDLPGSPHIYDYAVFPNGDTSIIGFFSGTTTGSLGGTQGILTGLWAVRFDQNNRVIWQRFFKTQAIPQFSGSILPDGSVVILKSGNIRTDSILKLDPNGYTVYWKHYSSIGALGNQTVSSDGSLILTGGGSNLLKLDPKGEITWSKEFVKTDWRIYPMYAFETRQGDLILAAWSNFHGTMVSRLNFSSQFTDCPMLSFVDNELWEYSPLPPYNISGSIKAKLYPTELEAADQIITLEENWN